jgi:hypothetical protein
VAELVPVRSRKPHRDAEKIVDEFRRFRQEHPLGDLSIRSLIEEGRRF